VTSTAWVLLGTAAALAVGDWIAVARGSPGLEYLCKPATTIALLGVAATLHPAHPEVRSWFAAALALCLVGDVALMLPAPLAGRDWFVVGLGAFLVAQLAFAVGFTRHGGTAGEYVLGAVLVTFVAAPLATRFVRALWRGGQRELVVPVLVYLGAIAAMATTAVGGSNAWGVAGAFLFVGSDALIAETRFVRPHRGAPVAIMVTYHLALAGLVLSLR
jgi:uncharacterized membrane protein YhhN